MPSIKDKKIGNQFMPREFILICLFISIWIPSIEGKVSRMFAEQAGNACLAESPIISAPHDCSNLPDSPGHPLPSPENSGEPDSFEKEKEKDNLHKYWATSRTASILCSISLDKSQFDKLVRSIQNRKEVSLFILYHSWKGLIF